jgi:hypothetical protein
MVLQCQEVARRRRAVYVRHAAYRGPGKVHRLADNRRRGAGIGNLLKQIGVLPRDNVLAI